LPYQGGLVGAMVEPDVPHAMARCVTAANVGGRLGDNFIEPGGALVQFLCQPLEVIKEIMHGLSQLDAVFSVMVVESCLECAEQAAATLNGEDHASEFAKELMSPCCGYAFMTAWDACQEGVQVFGMMTWQCKGHCNCVNVPFKDGVLSGPLSITFC